MPELFGMIEGVLDFDQAVPTRLFRAPIVDKPSGWQSRNWPAGATGTPRIAIAELRDRATFKAAGQDRDADFRGVVKVAVDVQLADGIEVDATALHHAGKKFYVLAVRVPEGAYKRVFLQEDPRAGFGT